MSDLISRQAAIKTAHLPVIDDASYEVVRVDDILALPSAQPDHIGEVTEMVGDVSCNGCKHMGNDFKCNRCVRAAQDNYEPWGGGQE